MADPGTFRIPLGQRVQRDGWPLRNAAGKAWHQVKREREHKGQPARHGRDCTD